MKNAFQRFLSAAAILAISLALISQPTQQPGTLGEQSIAAYCGPCLPGLAR